MVCLGSYSYGLYVYHQFISYYLTTNRTELELAHWLGSHGAAVALQATLGALASLALPELRVLREAVPRVEAAVRDGRGAGASAPGSARCRRIVGPRIHRSEIGNFWRLS
jgi:peptidoglycan/LPS O-acetylase OafA/YrhL